MCAPCMMDREESNGYIDGAAPELEGKYSVSSRTDPGKRLPDPIGMVFKKNTCV